MKKPLLIFVLSILSIGAIAQNLAWAKTLDASDYTFGNSIKADAAGNVYSTGYFKGIADFDPGPGTYNLTATVPGMFISKLDPAGKFVWAKKFEGARDYSFT